MTAKLDSLPRVLIIGLNYAPEVTGIAPYTTRLATGLAQKGWCVEVLTSFPHYPQWRTWAGHRGHTIHEDVDGVAVTRVRHYVPRRPSPALRLASELSFGARVFVSRWGRPDVIICPSPALFGCLAVLGRSRSRKFRPALGLIVHDLYSLGVQEAIAGPAVFARILRGIEGFLLRRADGVAVIHDRLKAVVMDSMGVSPDRVRTVRNWTHIPTVTDFDRAAFRQTLGWGSEVVVLHSGAMGDKQGLSNVVDAAILAERQGLALRFVLLGDGGQRDMLERRASRCGAVQFLDPLSSEDYTQALRAADVLLVNERPGVLEMALPSKLTSYFSAERPVVAATDPGSATAEEVAASGAGVRVDPGDPVALLRAVHALSEDPARAAELGMRGLSYCASTLGEDSALAAYADWAHTLLGQSMRRLAVSEGWV